jgi:uncharacterized membrane protein
MDIEGGNTSMTQTIIVGIVVIAAVAWAVWSIVKRARSGGGGCAACGSGPSCPYANKGVCPSELPEEAEESGGGSAG